jgi:hypothetical protein
MPTRTVKDCVGAIKALVKNSTLTDVQADELAKRMDTLARARVKRKEISLDAALKEIEGEISQSLKFEQMVDKRNRLLTIQAQRNVVAQVKKSASWGEGLQGFLEGGNKTTEGARFSVDYRSRAMYHKYFGSFSAELEQKGLTRAFRSGKIDREIYHEIAELNTPGGKPGITGNKEALQIAEAYNRIHTDMVARQNRAGAYIGKVPGYIMRQTHDSGEIQALGRQPDGKLNKTESFKKWYQMVLPLLDHDKTFHGGDPVDFLTKVHENLYTGVHGRPSDEAEVTEFFAHGSLAKSASAHRVLHFKDADSSFNYNQLFGTKNFSDGVLSDMLFRSRNITLMETFGPNPRHSFQEIVTNLRKEARSRDDGAEQVDRLEDWRVRASWAEVSGENEYPSNITLDKVCSTIRIVTQLSKMGGVVLSSLGDKAFLQSEMAFQGISQLHALGKQFTGMFSLSPAQKANLHMMGIALDSMIGNTISRYTIHSPGQNKLTRLQQRFYDLNFMNWWNDVHKSTAGEMMAHHLGMNAHLDHASLPSDLKKTLSLYDIGNVEWEALRTTAVVAPNGEKILTPSSLNNLPINLVDSIVNAKGWKVSPHARTRVIDELDSKLRTYFTDRIDIAVPTPGAGERKFLTLGTQAGTPLGESLRMMAMFKSFPLTITRKVIGRDVYGRGAKTIGDWFANDHRGKFAIAQLIAMTTIGGYLSGVVKDLVRGRTPKPLVDDNGDINWKPVNDAFLRGGGAGILGDFLFTEYDRSYKSLTGVLAGPVFGQADMLSAGASKLIRGENPTQEFSKVILNNTPFINLFYIRPILDYFVLWNMQEMLHPGFIKGMTDSVEEQGQEFLINPNDAVR